MNLWFKKFSGVEKCETANVRSIKIHFNDIFTNMFVYSHKTLTNYVLKPSSGFTLFIDENRSKICLVDF